MDDSINGIPRRETVLKKVLELFDEFRHVSNLRCSAQKSELLAMEQPVGVLIQGITVLHKMKFLGVLGGDLQEGDKYADSMNKIWYKCKKIPSGPAAGSQNPAGTPVGVPDTLQCGDSGANALKGLGAAQEVCPVGAERHIPHGSKRHSWKPRHGLAIPSKRKPPHTAEMLAVWFWQHRQSILREDPAVDAGKESTIRSGGPARSTRAAHKTTKEREGAPAQARAAANTEGRLGASGGISRSLEYSVVTHTKS